MSTTRTSPRHPCALRLAACSLAFIALGATAQPVVPEPPEPMAAGLIVKFRDGARTAVAKNATMQGLRAHALGRGLAVVSERETGTGARVMQLQRHVSAKSLEAVARELERYDMSIEYVQPNYIAHATFTPNDTYFADQWALTNSKAGISAAAAWDISKGTGTRVAVVDTGVLPHADLAANLLPGYDFITSTTLSNDSNGRESNAYDPGDWAAAGDCGTNKPARNSSWHGTHVAGIIAALGNNAQGVTGVAPLTKIVPVRALGRCGAGAIADIMDGALWAAGVAVPGVPANVNPVRIVNMSLGYVGACSAYEQDAITKVTNLGVLVVVAAGNENIDASKFAPASCKNAFTVGATNNVGARSAYSNFGTTLALSAPGGDPAGAVLSTLNTGTTTPMADSFGGYTGTSMAAPHVAGVAALVMAANPGMPTANVRLVLAESVSPFGQACSNCGAGIVSAEKAVKAARGWRYEHEPNENIGSANVMVHMPGEVLGSLQGTTTTDDLDHYMVSLPPRSTLTVDLINLATYDMDLSLLDKSGKLIVTSKSGGVGKGEYLVRHNTSYDVTETWYVKVHRGALSARTATAQPYRLKFGRGPLPY